MPLRDALDRETSAPSWLIARARHELIRRPSTRTVSTALPAVATLFRTGQFKTLAKEIKERNPGIVQHDVSRQTVHGKRNRQPSGCPLGGIVERRFGCLKKAGLTMVTALLW